MRNPFCYFNISPEVFRLKLITYVGYPLSLRQVGDLLFLRRAMKRYGQPRVIVTDRLQSYRAAMNMIGDAADQECGLRLNNRAANSHQPFRRREGAMAKFRDVKTLQKFASGHASIHNHFNLERHLNRRDKFKQDRAAALAEWRQLAA